jgi:transposase InsO family protein
MCLASTSDLPPLKWSILYLRIGSQERRSFNGKLRDELLNGEIFDTVIEARIIIERWRREYNTRRPHSSLRYLPPAPEAILPLQTNQLDLNRGISNIQVGT